eukprot:176709-Pelagomonas_calceolata.AAC.1
MVTRVADLQQLLHATKQYQSLHNSTLVADLQQQLHTTKQRQSLHANPNVEELERAQADVQWLQRHNLRLEEALSCSQVCSGCSPCNLWLEEVLSCSRLSRCCDPSYRANSLDCCVHACVYYGEGLRKQMCSGCSTITCGWWRCCPAAT